MKICVQGLWHLGVVTATGLVKMGHTVRALDYDAQTVDNLVAGILPVEEPDVRDLLGEGRHTNRLTFTSEANAIGDCEIFWLAYDTPIDENDVADVGFVIEQFRKSAPYINLCAVIIVSSQLPVGSTRKLKEIFDDLRPGNSAKFVSQPENLRLGKALDSFLKAERFIVGTESSAADPVLIELFAPFNTSLEWMSIESAEMTKHAINAFLATSITFMNEISDICEIVGADVKAVERGLRTDSRIGKKAYVSPGLGFSGGTLARDVKYLESLEGKNRGGKTLLSSLIPSNRFHNDWVKRKIHELYADRKELNIVFWGLTYTSNTSTLRRSAMLELATALSKEGHHVSFFEDPLVEVPLELMEFLTREKSPIESISTTDVVVVSKKMLEFGDPKTISMLVTQEKVRVLDPSRHLAGFLNVEDLGQRYLAVGSANDHR